VLLLAAEKAENSQALQAANDKTLSRKLDELRMAVAAEQQHSKQQILAGYLNNAYFGNFAYGIEAAAYTYFGNLRVEAVGDPGPPPWPASWRIPSAYNPRKNPGLALTRRKHRAGQDGPTNNGLSAAEAAADRPKPLGLKFAIPESGCQSSFGGLGRFFCQYVRGGLPANPAYGKTPMDRAKLLATGGLKIYTTLNPKDQHGRQQAP